MKGETGKWIKDMWRRAPKPAVIVLLALILTALFADFLALHHPEIGDPGVRLLPPAWESGGRWTYALGTDTMGRDVLSRMIYGTRVSLLVAFSAVIVAGLIGTILGLLSGFFGGWVDQVIMRFTDAWLSIPTVMFGILMAIILGPGVWNIVIILGGTFWSRYARVVRGETLSVKTRDFVSLARIAGCTKTRIIFKHIMPNVFHHVITLSSLQIGIVIVAEASLTFLGVGIPAPKPAWGLMLSEGRGGLLAGYWWLVVFPGVGIALLVFSFNVIGDWLRRYLDPFYRNIE